MIDPELIALLRCPLTSRELQVAPETLIASLNAAIEEGRLRDAVDQKVEAPIEGGLLAEGGDRLYPIRSGIPNMVVEESIPLADHNVAGS